MPVKRLTAVVAFCLLGLIITGVACWGTLAILLTGASSDGSDGVAAVRQVGGEAWIQCPEEAYSSMMPASALAHAGADAVLPLTSICTRMKGLTR